MNQKYQDERNIPFRSGPIYLNSCFNLTPILPFTNFQLVNNIVVSIEVLLQFLDYKNIRP